MSTPVEQEFQEVLEKAFKKYDINGDGFIDEDGVPVMWHVVMCIMCSRVMRCAAVVKLSFRSLHGGARA